MGNLLTKPKLEKTILSDKNNELMFGYCSMQGWRVQMEDTHSVILNMEFPFHRWSFFAVFDGHNGDKVSIKCSTHLLPMILKTEEFQLMKFDDFGNPKSLDSLRMGVRRGFLNFDEYLRTLPEIFCGNDQSGSTAICVFITPRYIILINCGDSRGILIRGSECYFGTRDHKPYDTEESARITKAGGSIIADRINGCLALSRSLGDFIYKKSINNTAFDQLVSPDPTISVFERMDSDQMVVLCCDGIWDVINNNELCEFILSRCARINDLGKVAEDVVNLCFHKGSKDNMTALVILLKNYMIIDEELALEDFVLNKLLRERVNEYYENHPTSSVTTLIKWIQAIDFPNLPPGGLTAKRSVIEEEFERLKGLQRPEAVDTPSSLRLKYLARSNSKSSK